MAPEQVTGNGAGPATDVWADGLAAQAAGDWAGARARLVGARAGGQAQAGQVGGDGDGPADHVRRDDPPRERLARHAVEQQVRQVQRALAVARHDDRPVGRDLALSNPRVTGADRQALQTAFEARLAALALTRLDRPGDDVGSRYRTLADLYSYVFLVQDSPRLPPETRSGVLSTIGALVEGRPVDDEDLVDALTAVFERSVYGA